MASYTYELHDASVLLSNVRRGLMDLGGEWVEVASFMPQGHVEYRPLKINPMRSGYRYVYQRALLNLTLYFPEKIFERLLEILTIEKLQLFKSVIQSSLPRRSGYDLNEFKIRGIIGEDGSGNG